MRGETEVPMAITRAEACRLIEQGARENSDYWVAMRELNLHLGRPEWESIPRNARIYLEANSHEEGIAQIKKKVFER